MPHLRAATKDAAISELLDVLAARGHVTDEPAARQAVLARERAGTTAAGRGLALPHAKTDAVDRTALALGRPSEPVPFGLSRGEPAELIVLLLSPPAAAQDHIRLLARLARVLESDGLRRRIARATDAQGIHDLLRERELKLY